MKLIFWLVTFFIERSTIFSIHDCNIRENHFIYNFKNDHQTGGGQQVLQFALSIGVQAMLYQ